MSSAFPVASSLNELVSSAFPLATSVFEISDKSDLAVLSDNTSLSLSDNTSDEMSSNMVIFLSVQFIFPEDSTFVITNNSVNPSLIICCSNFKGLSSNLFPIIQLISDESASILHWVINSSGYVTGILKLSLVVTVSLTVPLILNSPFSWHELPSIAEGVNIIGNFALLSSSV